MRTHVVKERRAGADVKKTPGEVRGLRADAGVETQPGGRKK